MAGTLARLPVYLPVCLPLCLYACRHAGIQVLEWCEYSRVATSQNAKKMVTRSGKERHKLPRQRQMLPHNGKEIQPLRKSPSFAGETVGMPASGLASLPTCLPVRLPLCLPAHRHTGKGMVERQKADAVPNGRNVKERVAKERHKLPRQRQMLPRNSKEIQPWKKSFSFAGGMVGAPDCLPVCPANGCRPDQETDV